MNEVEALLPKDFDPTRRYRALYVLPVEAGRQTQFGDPGTELTQLGIADRYGLLCVIPRFDTMPWYGAHATHPRMRHEEYLKEVVVPLIESCYPVVGGAEGRLLLGFSKSGFGAYSLILRDPAFFGYAAAWDAPLMLSAANYGAYETAAHFGSRENFRKYLPLELLARNAHAFTDKSRLVLAGSSLFGDQPGDLFRATPHTATFHQRMEELGVQHRYNNELPRKHHWNSGWMGPVVEALMSLVQDEDQASAQT
jgi:S-formylglutathione hydrolase FrmB